MKMIACPENGDPVLVDGRDGKITNAEDATYSDDEEWEVEVEFDEEDDEGNETWTLKHDSALGKWVSP